MGRCRRSITRPGTRRRKRTRTRKDTTPAEQESLRPSLALHASRIIFQASRITLRSRELLPQIRAHQLTLFETVEAEFLIRRMRIVVRQRQAEHQGVGMENLFEVIYDRNRSAFAHQHRFAA